VNRKALIVGALGVVVLAAVAAIGLGLLRGGRERDAEQARERFLAAVARGDSEAARAVVDALDPALAETGAARLMLASNAALAGHHEAARFWLGDPAELEAPLRCEAYLLAAGIDRLADPGGLYADAAADYRRVLGDPDCADGADDARRGLGVACLLVGADSREVCADVQVLRTRSNAERELVLSLILATDGHATPARNRLQQALAAIGSGQQLGCAGLEALRTWAAPGRLDQDDPLWRTLGSVGRRQARTAADCALFGGMGEGP